jgi:hypothetical protein
MGGGNGLKSAMRRERLQKKDGGGKGGSQLKVNEAVRLSLSLLILSDFHAYRPVT